MNDAEWRALAAKNPQRVTYPTWKPPEFWAARTKKDPWVPVEDNRNFWKRGRIKRVMRIIRPGWKSDPVPSGPPSGIEIEPRPKSWDHAPEHLYRRRSGW